MRDKNGFTSFMFSLSLVGLLMGLLISGFLSTVSFMAWF